MLYSQQYIDRACLKIVTTPSSSEILYAQLRIDPASEEPAVVKTLTQFVVDEAHHRFSGTEMRISLPCPSLTIDVEQVADTLAVYFQSSRYTLPPFLSVEFCFDVGEVSTRVDFAHVDEPIDRFIADLGANIEDIVYTHDSKRYFSVTCMALMPGDKEFQDPGDIEICVLRYANHVPLVNAEDIYLCGITKGVLDKCVWKKFGFRCRRSGTHLVNQLVASPLRSSSKVIQEGETRRQLVLAIDICSNGADGSDATGGALRYGCLKKSTLDRCYSDAVRICCRSVLQQLVDQGVLRTPQQCRDDDLITHFAPLIASAVVSIAKHSMWSSPLPPTKPEPGILRTQESKSGDVEEVTSHLQRLLRDDIGYKTRE